MLVSLIENIEEIKKEIRTNPSNSFDIIKNNVPKYTMYQYVRECNKNNLNNFAFRFGRCVSDNFGVFLIVIVMYVIEAVCYAVVCSKIKSWGSSLWLNVGTLIFFAVLPAFGAYAQVVMKDGVFTAFFALFFVLYIEFYLKYIKRKQQDSVLKRCFALGIAELAVALTRNNGIYMVLASDVVLLIFIIRKRRLLVAAFVMTVGVTMLYQFAEGP